MSDSRLCVTLLVSDLSLSGAGRWGGAVRVFLLKQAIEALGYCVEVVGFTFGESGVKGVKAIAAREYPEFVCSAQKLLQTIQGDIVYALKPKATSFGVALWQKLIDSLTGARRDRRPVILDIDDWELSWYGGDSWQYRPTLKQFARDLLKSGGALRQPNYPLYLRWLEKLANQADAVTVHTRFLQDRFGGVYVPNGKDVALFDPSRYDADRCRARYGLSGYRILMFPGAPRPYKGVEDVLMALDRLNQPDLRLVIVGGSPYDDYDAQLMRQWSRWLIQRPKLPYAEMPAIVAAADMVVVPQRQSAATAAQFPLKLTDGMAMAKPVLATKVGDIPEILGETGYLVAPDAPDQLAEAIEWILTHPTEVQQRGTEARSRCCQHYSITAMSAALAPVFSSLP